MSESNASPRGAAVILLSGGVDSATCLALARQEGFSCHCMSFDYGQKHRIELEAAARVAASLGAADHRIVMLDAAAFRGSTLTDGGTVPKGRSLAQIAHGIPSTYVPARNTIFLAHGLGWAEVLSAENLFIGVNAIDYSGYPDCRPEFIETFERLGRLATKAGVEGRPFQIRTPLLRLSKAEILRLGTSLGVDFRITLSCYDPDTRGLACGGCDSCQLRKKGFADAGLPDPTRYR